MKEPVMKALLNTIPQIGLVDWIGLRPGRREEINIVESVSADTDSGLVGDRFNSKFNKNRQVTLIQKEHIDVIRSIMKNKSIEPALLRRNIVVEGINLLSLKNKEFHIGSAKLRGTGLCHPCTRMEENLGEGGYNAVRGHGGITAQVIENGQIAVGDEIYLAL